VRHEPGQPPGRVAAAGRDRCRAARSARAQNAAVCGQFALSAVLAGYAGLGPAGWVAGAVYAVALRALLTAALRRAGARAPGPADLVTLARAVLTGGVTALVVDHGAGQDTAIAALATVALVLDAVDGRVARRTGTASAHGARFDMEVDAFLILVLSLHVAARLGAWVTLIGAMRYVFAAAGRVMPWLRGPLPPSTARKTVAAVQGIVLAAAGAGVVGRPVAQVLVAVALALLAGSFGRDVVFLRRAARTAQAAGGLRGEEP
jgi:phosphatidylglycerophosphate synthase